MKIKKKIIFILTALISLVAVTFSGCSSVTVDGKNVFGIVEEKDRNMFCLVNWRFTSGLRNNVIICNAEEGVAFEMSTEQGRLYYGNWSKSVIVPSNDGASWQDYCEEGEAVLSEGEYTYISAKLKKNGSIAGYGVIKVVRLSGLEYRASVVKSVLFPEINGKVQEVTDGQVNLLIDNCKK